MWNSSSSSSNGRTALRDGAEKGRLEKGSDKMDDGCMKRTHTLPVGRGGGLSFPPTIVEERRTGLPPARRTQHIHAPAQCARIMADAISGNFVFFDGSIHVKILRLPGGGLNCSL